MYCRNYTGTVSRVLCREVNYILCPLSEVPLYSSSSTGRTFTPQHVHAYHSSVMYIHT